VRRSVVIRPRAEQDIEEARNWYEKRQPNLGSSFLDEVSRAVRALEMDADRFPVYYRDFRRILLPRFPYKLFYLLDNERVVVFRVLHAKREHHRHLPPAQT